MRSFVRSNQNIRATEVRCVDSDGSQVGVVPLSEARALADKRGLDLVEIAPDATPPVCRIMDFGKFRYEQTQKTKKSKKAQSHGTLKEIKFHANVAEHDYQTKLRHAREFLAKGHKLKASLFFRGRENAHREFGFELISRVAKDCSDLGHVEMEPRMVGRNLVVVMSPNSKK